MLRNFSFGGKLSGSSIRDPRLMMRAIIGLLLLANLVVALIAFKPFGGSADDLRREEASLRGQRAALEGKVGSARRLVSKVETARKEGDLFLEKYVTEHRVVTSTVQEELNRMAREAGGSYLPITMNEDQIEGSDTLWMMTINAGYQGTYANLTKFVNLVDKSPLFLIIENMQLSPQQTGQNLNVSLKVLTFYRDQPATSQSGAAL
jgi:type IV pilus assembly protein PilO